MSSIFQDHDTSLVDLESGMEVDLSYIQDQHQISLGNSIQWHTWCVPGSCTICMNPHISNGFLTDSEIFLKQSQCLLTH